MRSRKSHRSVLVNALWLLALMAQPFAFPEGRVEHHQMTSRILADAGQPADRELSIYLPEEYDTSGLAYPVMYLIHGGSISGENPLLTSNRVWFAYGVDSLFDLIPEPLIIVMPSMGGFKRIIEVEEAYLLEEIIPFVDGSYRTILYREGRAISGMSRGGVDALYIALSRPELFSVVGLVSPGSIERALPGRDMIKAHPQKLSPLQFWLAYGRNEQLGITASSREFVRILEELGIPVLYIEDDSDHFDLVAAKERGWGCLEFISKTLGGGVTSVELLNGIPDTWGRIKAQH